MRHIIPVLLLFRISMVFSQQAGTVTGNTSDNNNKSLELVNITLYRSTDSVFVKAAITDEKGRFEIEQLPFESYYIKAELSGYEKFRSPVFVLNAEKSCRIFRKLYYRPKPTNSRKWW